MTPDLDDEQREALRYFLAYIQDQIDCLDSTDCPPRDDHRAPRDAETLAEWLSIESGLTKPSLEEKIRGCQRRLFSGNLTPVENFYFRHRLNLAGLVIDAILPGSAAWELGRIRHWPANFADEREMRAWLLIDVWNVFEEAFLAKWTRGFLAEVTREKSLRTVPLGTLKMLASGVAARVREIVRAAWMK